MSVSVRLALVVALCLIWGSTWPVIKIGLETLPPFHGAGFRFALAAAVLFGLSWAQGVAMPRRIRTHLALLAHGLIGIGLSYGAVYWGEQHIPSGLSAVLFATNPFFVMLLAHLAVAGERVTSRRLVGMVVGFAGVALIFRDDLQMAHPLAVTPAGVTLLSPLAAAVSNVAIKRWGGHLHPYTLTALPMTYASVGLFVASWMTEDTTSVAWTATAVGSVVYLAVVGSVAAFVTYYTLLKHVAVSTLAFVTYTFPVAALILGYLLLGETLAAQALVGAGVVVVGIAVATAAPRRR